MNTAVAVLSNEKWEISTPRYRVTLWAADGGREDWDVEDAPDVEAALEWARGRTPAGGRHEVAVLLDHASFGLGLITVSRTEPANG